MRLRHGEFLGAVAGGFDWPAASIRVIHGDRPIAPHQHDALPHFVVLIAGVYASEARRRPLDSAALIFNPAGIAHRDRFLGAGTLLAVAPSERSVKSACAELPDAPHCLPGAPADALSRMLAPLLAAPATDGALDVEEVVLELLAAAAGDRIAAERARPRWLAAYCDSIRDDPFRSPAARAADFDLHPVYAARTLRRFTGCSPARLARIVRLRAAAEQLRTSELPVAAIAADQGFSDQAHLTRQFRAHFGTTPNAFRLRGG